MAKFVAGKSVVQNCGEYVIVRAEDLHQSKRSTTTAAEILRPWFCREPTASAAVVRE